MKTRAQKPRLLLEEMENRRLQIMPVNLGDARLAELELPQKYKEKDDWLLTPKEFARDCLYSFMRPALFKELRGLCRIVENHSG